LYPETECLVRKKPTPCKEKIEMRRERYETAVAIRLPEEFRSVLKRACDESDRTLTGYIRHALMQQLRRDGLWPQRSGEAVTP
jgi:hypothetical protein